MQSAGSEFGGAGYTGARARMADTGMKDSRGDSRGASRGHESHDRKVVAASGDKERIVGDSGIPSVTSCPNFGALVNVGTSVGKKKRRGKK